MRVTARPSDRTPLRNVAVPKTRSAKDVLLGTVMYRGLFLLTLCGLGCTGRTGDKWRAGLPRAYPATGMVTYNGKPLAEATVVFHAQVPALNRSVAAVGRTDAAGRFALRTYRDADGAIAGSHQVTVSKVEIVSPSGRPLVPDETGDVLEMFVQKTLIPKRYRLADTSGLSATVTEKGPNQFRFSLDDSGTEEARRD